MDQLFSEPTKNYQKKLANRVFLFLLSFYKAFLSPYFGGSCRFHPSCSEYAVQVLKTHRFFPALYLILLRLSKCRPFGAFGYDPAPKPKQELL